MLKSHTMIPIPKPFFSFLRVIYQSKLILGWFPVTFLKPLEGQVYHGCTDAQRSKADLCPRTSLLGIVEETWMGSAWTWILVKFCYQQRVIRLSTEVSTRSHSFFSLWGREIDKTVLMFLPELTNIPWILFGRCGRSGPREGTLSLSVLLIALVPLCVLLLHWTLSPSPCHSCPYATAHSSLPGGTLCSACFLTFCQACFIYCSPAGKYHFL